MFCEHILRQATVLANDLNVVNSYVNARGGLSPAVGDGDGSPVLGEGAGTQTALPPTPTHPPAARHAHSEPRLPKCCTGGLEGKGRSGDGKRVRFLLLAHHAHSETRLPKGRTRGGPWVGAGARW